MSVRLRAADLVLRDQIQRLALQMPAYGYRRVTAALQREGVLVNHKRVLRLGELLALHWRDVDLEERALGAVECPLQSGGVHLQAAEDQTLTTASLALLGDSCDAAGEWFWSYAVGYAVSGHVGA